MSKRRRYALSVVALALAPALGVADVVTDGSLGPRVRLSGAAVEVGAELGRRRGGNLFHSFERLDVATGGRVTFTGPTGIDNVIARVTGGQRSTIDGLLRSVVPGAELYLMNPAGIVFGPQASLDVPAAFHVATADQLRFADGTTFSAGDATGGGLTVAAPAAFGFLGAPAGRIDIERSLLAPGPSFELVAGDVEVSGAQLVTSPTRGATRGGDIRIAAGRLVVAGGASVRTVATDRDAGELTVEAARIEVTRAELGSRTVGAGAAGSVTLRVGEALAVSGRNPDPRFASGLFADAEDGSTGDAGRVEIAAAGAAVTVAGGAEIRASTFGEGRAGTIDIAAGALRVSNAGDPGFLGIKADIEESASTKGDRGGLVKVRADRLEVSDNGVIRSLTFAEGDAGDVEVHAGEVLVSRGGQIATGVLAPGTGSGGAALVVARDRIRIDGVSPTAPPVNGEALPSGIFASAESGRSGPGGDIEVSAPVLIVRNGGQISADNFGDSAAGTLRVTTGELLRIDDSRITTTNRGAGAGGALEVTAHGLVELRAGGVIRTEVLGGPAEAGDITIKGPPRFLVLNDGQVVARVQRTGATARGGDIAIDADRVLSTPTSVVNADAGSAGVAGRIVIVADIVDVSSALTVLPTAFLGIDRLLQQSCSARRAERASSFTAAGRGGLPPGPEAPLAAGYALEEQLVAEDAVAAGHVAGPCGDLEEVAP
jgi:filamentous hemagglutinin family protein